MKVYGTAVKNKFTISLYHSDCRQPHAHGKIPLRVRVVEGLKGIFVRPFHVCSWVDSARDDSTIGRSGFLNYSRKRCYEPFFFAIIGCILESIRVSPQGITMEQIVNLHIEKLPEGVYLATSDDLPGLIAQGRTVSETVEIARDVARKLIEARGERDEANRLTVVKDVFDYPLILSA